MGVDSDFDFLGKGLAFPTAVDPSTGKLKTSAAEDLIDESILLILGTAKGERVMRPDFGCGIRDLVFARNSTMTATVIEVQVREALLRWEPRIELTSVEVKADENEENRLNIGIGYRVKTTNARRNLVYPFYLEGTA